MANRYLMAVDAGTGSVRAVLFNEDGAQLSCVQREWTHSEDPRYPGSMDFDWVHNWELASECIRGAIAQAGVDAGDIAAVSTTCMREGIVLYDEAGEEIWACANVDARSDDEVGQLIRDKGHEYGTVTGRPRRTGWFDAVILRYAVRVNGLTQLAVNKLDTLAGVGDLKVCTAYRLPDGTLFQAAIEGVLPSGELILRHADGTRHEYLFREIEFVIAGKQGNAGPAEK